MKHVLLMLVLCIGTHPLFAQLKDDFNDHDLTIAPHWQGMDTSFISENGRLRSNHKMSNSQFYISSEFSAKGDLEWMLDVQIGFNPSSLNYIDFILLSDTADLLKMKNGVLLRIGGSSDEISLFKVIQGIESKIIDGKDGLLNFSGSHYKLHVVFKNDSFILTHQKKGTKAFTEEGRVYYNLPQGLKNSGIRIRQSTSGFFGKHYFDDLYAGDLIPDTTGPCADSIKLLSDTSICCYFNEPCDSVSLSNVKNFTIDGSIYPNYSLCSVDLMSTVLVFKDKLPFNRYFVLESFGIMDKFNNNSDTQMQSLIWYKTETAGLYDLLITEMMVDPEPQVGLPAKEYIEIQNVSEHFISLDSCSVSDLSLLVNLPSMVLHPDSFLLMYTIPSLNNAGDEISLRNRKGELIHKVSYTDAWYNDELRSEGGYSLEMIDPGRPCLGSINWTASRSLSGGTPGAINSVSATLDPDTLAPVILNWISEKDSLLTLMFSEFPEQTIKMKCKINEKPVDLKLYGVYPTEKKLSYRMYPFVSKDSLYNVCFSGFEDCEGNRSGEQCSRLQWPSIAEYGDILFNEILFNPVAGGSDFVELYNNSNKLIDLSSVYIADLDAGAYVQNMYPLTQDYKLFYPGTYCVLSQDTADICKRYACGASALFIQVKKMPLMPDREGRIQLFNIHSASIDSLYYSETYHFPLLNTKEGVSLERLRFDIQSTESNNWHSAASAIGYASPGKLNSQFIIHETQDKYFNLNTATFSPDQDGHHDLLILSYTLPDPDFMAEVKIYDIQGRLIRNLIRNETLGTKGMISWEGTNDHSEIMTPGIYILIVECIHPDGRRFKEKFTVVLAAYL